MRGLFQNTVVLLANKSQTQKITTGKNSYEI